VGIADAIHKKEARLKALWSPRLANQMSVLPKFDEVFRVLRRTLANDEPIRLIFLMTFVAGKRYWVWAAAVQQNAKVR